MSSLDILWYSRSAHPCPLGLAAQLGGLLEEFRDDDLRVFTVQDSLDATVRESHVDHHLPNFIRQGGNTTALWARSRGARTKLIGLNWMEEFQGILTLPDSDVQTLADLRGRRLALPVYESLIDNPRAEALHGFLQALAQEGLGPSDVKFIDLPIRRSSGSGPLRPADRGLSGEYVHQMTALQCREVDAVYVKGARGLQACRIVNAHLLFDLRRLPDPRSRVHNGAPRPITVDEALLRTHPAVVERFLSRVLLAGTWAARHPRETHAYLARETRTSEGLVRDAYGPNVHQHLGTDLSPTNLEALQAHKQFLLDWGFLPRDFDLQDWIDPAPLAAARRRVPGEVASSWV